MIVGGVFSIAQIGAQIQQYEKLKLGATTTGTLIVSIFSIIPTIGFIVGLAYYKSLPEERKDEKAKRFLVKQWYWQYAAIVIQGIGMTAVNFSGM